ncbi:MAG: 50S ribosomal protein L25 [Spirochaetales bacterium]|nr:50S ribosomal protein L25 [Spirochaetales bacterium]
MNEKKLSARTRTKMGKGPAKALRQEGRLPAVMYNGEGKSTMVDIDALEFSKLFATITESTIIDVSLDGAKDVLAFVKDVQYDIIKDQVKHVDLYVVEAGKILRTKIQVKLSGAPVGVRQGGVLEHGTKEIEVECLPRNLPEKAIVDVSNLELNHSLHVKDIVLPEGVKVLSDKEKTIATIRMAK